MNSTTEQLDAFRRYTELIRAASGTALPSTFDLESASALQVERGVVFADAMIDGYSQAMSERVSPLIEATLSGRGIEHVSIIDRAGHHRPAYRGLVIYAWLQTYRLLYEKLPQAEFARWEEPLRAWCDLLEYDLSNVIVSDAGIPAGQGGDAARAAWNALALAVAGKIFHRDAWTDLASETFGRLTRSQQPSGELLIAGPSDNPETHGYDELVLLHAMASYAVQNEDRTVAAAVRRSTEFHLKETQPDHATSEPWALFAFIWNPNTRSLADQMLHATATQQTMSESGVALKLLADALYCLRLFP